MRPTSFKGWFHAQIAARRQRETSCRANVLSIFCRHLARAQTATQANDMRTSAYVGQSVAALRQIPGTI